MNKISNSFLVQKKKQDIWHHVAGTTGHITRKKDIPVTNESSGNPIIEKIFVRFESQLMKTLHEK